MKLLTKFTQLAGVLLASVLVVFSAPQALAHDSVIGGSVTNGQVLQQFPETITLEFSAVPKEGFNTFAVTNVETEEVLFDAEPEVNGRDLTVEVPGGVNPGPGEYQIGYQITSSDGHATRGSVPFSVAESGEDVSQSTGDQSDESSLPLEEKSAEDISRGMKIILGFGAILAAFAVIIMLVAKMRGNNKKG